jgi:hypothetical protein
MRRNPYQPKYSAIAMQNRMTATVCHQGGGQ